MKSVVLVLFRCKTFVRPHLKTATGDGHEVASGLSKTPHLRAFTLVESSIALTIFALVALGSLEVLNRLNQTSAVNRAAVSAQTLLGAKVNKLLNTAYDLRSKRVPAPCDLSTNAPAGTNVFNGIDVGVPDTYNSLQTPDDGYSKDTADFWGAVAAGSTAPPLGTQTILVSDAANIPIVVGKIYRRTSNFEALTKTMEVTYSLVYTIASRTYVAQQTVVRAPDEQ